MSYLGVIVNTQKHYHTLWLLALKLKFAKLSQDMYKGHYFIISIYCNTSFSTF